jgi:hypothetical protein
MKKWVWTVSYWLNFSTSRVGCQVENCEYLSAILDIVWRQPRTVGAVGWRGWLARLVGAVGWRGWLARLVGAVGWRGQLYAKKTFTRMILLKKNQEKWKRYLIPEIRVLFFLFSGRRKRRKDGSL